MENPVPNVLALTIVQARQLLESQGFILEVSETNQPGGAISTFEQQSDGARRRVVRQRCRGSVAELVVGTAAGYLNQDAQTGDLHCDDRP